MSLLGLLPPNGRSTGSAKLRGQELVVLGIRRMGKDLGAKPVELLGGVPFPEIGELPYLLTLSGYGFYWFRLTAPEPTEEGQLL